MLSLLLTLDIGQDVFQCNISVKMTDLKVFTDKYQDKKSELMTTQKKTILKMEWKQVMNIEQLDVLINESEENPVLIFKHSTRCGISRMVLRQFEKDFDLENEITPYFLDLLQHRDVSNAIENKLGIRHESPQLIVIKNGIVVYNASHGDIAATDLIQFTQD